MFATVLILLLAPGLLFILFIVIQAIRLGRSAIDQATHGRPEDGNDGGNRPA